MDLSHRIKKELTEGIVKAILEDAGYRVIESGIEKIVRELSCINPSEYADLGHPRAMRYLPDFTVMDRDQKKSQLVEVKYRSSWNKELLEEVREQVDLLGEIVLISINANAEDPKGINGSDRYIRCCGLKFESDQYMIERSRYSTENHTGQKEIVWERVNGVHLKDNALWWSMLPLKAKFPQINEKRLSEATQALAGILHL